MPHVRATRHVSKDGSKVVERRALTKSVLIGEISGILSSRLRLMLQIPTAVEIGSSSKIVRVYTDQKPQNPGVLSAFSI